MPDEKTTPLLIGQLGPPLSPEKLEKLEREHAKVKTALEAIERGRQEKARCERIAHLKSKVRILIADLNRGTSQLPAISYSSVTIQDPDELALRRTREYFHRMRSKFGARRDGFIKLIGQYGLAQRAVFNKGLAVLLFPPLDPVDLHHPNCIEDMPHLWKATPRTGGRRRTPRNKRIEELKAHHTKHHTIARTLTQEGHKPPSSWGVYTFAEAYQDPDLRSLFHKMCSTNKPIKKSPPFRR